MRVPGARARLPACRHGNRTWTQRESCGDDRAGDGDQRQRIAGKAGAAGGQCVATDIRGYRCDQWSSEVFIQGFGERRIAAKLRNGALQDGAAPAILEGAASRSEEHTPELPSLTNIA